MSKLSNPGNEGLAARLMESNGNVAPAQNPEIVNPSTQRISSDSLAECVRIATASGTSFRQRVAKLLSPWRPMRENYFKQGKVDEKDGDAVFICTDGSVVAHRVVLATSSKLFADLLAEEVDDRSIVAVPNVTCDTMKAVLEVIYTGRLTATLETIKDVAGLLTAFGMGTGRFELTLEEPSDSALMPPPQSPARNVSGTTPNPITCLVGNIWCLAGFLKEKEPANDVICSRLQLRRERGVPFPENESHIENRDTHGPICAAGQPGGKMGPSMKTEFTGTILGIVKPKGKLGESIIANVNISFKAYLM